MKSTVLIVIALVGAPPCFAQAYKCNIDGKPVFQQVPCDGGTKLSVPKPPDPNSRDAKIGSAIARKRLILGMTSAEVIRSWGKPDRINRNISSGSTTEQWIYENGEIGDTQYVYIDNGVLRSVQTPR